ncbi:universal stress protein [Thalassobacillus sp. CUG 92003]|uniref:universal stress protein n=1 Tax=Thalassobacillus sp. CUG 92003 TaxID=2736641 RepID=UPI0015E689B2|nr:universal stress protein [Thalassobacillus sp. CUG 92003]
MTRKLLVAYDGSNLSRNAVKEAMKQASELPDTEVHVISIIKSTGPVTNKAISRSIGDELAQESQDQLNHIKEEFDTDVTKVHTDVVVGNPDDNPGISICNYAKENDMDLIIVGSRGLGNVKKIFLGSVSNSIVQNATCPVLVMK